MRHRPFAELLDVEARYRAAVSEMLLATHERYPRRERVLINRLHRDDGGKIQAGINHLRRIRWSDVWPARHRTRSPRQIAGGRLARREVRMLPMFKDFGLDRHGLPYVENVEVRWGTDMVAVHTIVSGLGHQLHLDQKYPPNHVARAHDIRRAFPPAPLSGTPAKMRAAMAAGDRGIHAAPLTAEERRANYVQRGGCRWPTPRQRRRLAHKQNLADLRATGT